MSKGSANDMLARIKELISGNELRADVAELKALSTHIQSSLKPGM